MLTAGKMIGALWANRNRSNATPLIDELLSGIATIVGLALLAALFTGVLAIGAFFFLYRVLVENGLQPEAAMLSVGGLVVICVGVLLALLQRSIRATKTLPLKIMQAQSPVASRAQQVGNAFLDGLLRS